jgi:hypothetical protein
MRAAFQGQLRHDVKFKGAFRRPANRAAIVVGQDAHLGSYLALPDSLQRGAVLGGRLLEPFNLLMARFITAHNSFSV